MNNDIQNKEKYMKIAYKEAQKAYLKNEVPVGAIIVRNGEIIAKAYNLREQKNNALAHAEIICINKACKMLKTWRLEDCQMYVTLEPCPMCAGAIIQSRISSVYIGALDKKNGAIKSIMNMFDYDYTHKVKYETGILEKMCSMILSDFFKEMRNIKSK